MTVVKYTRYYFPNGLRWTMLVLLLPSFTYFLFFGWYILACVAVLVLFFLWTTKYETLIDLKKRVIRDTSYTMMIPRSKSVDFRNLVCLEVTTEQQKYKAASRTRDYWVRYTEYTLNLRYDDQSLILFTMNDGDDFKQQVEKFARELNLSISQNS